MKKLFTHSLITFALVSAIGFSSCSDNDDNNPTGETPEVTIPEASKEEVAKELEAISKALKAINGSDDLQLTDFIREFSDSEFNLDTDELTVFAFEDDRNENPDEFEGETLAAKVTKATASSKKNVHKHILKGKHNFNFVKADKEYVYKTINGNEIIISKRNNVIYVNGVAMKKNEFYNNTHGKGSHIYCVKDVLPEDKVSASKVDNVYDIRVMQITGDTKNPYTPSKDAFVILFEENGNGGYKQIGKVRTNDQGYTSVFYKGNKNLYYKASLQEYKYIYKGFLVAGMYTSADEVKNALPHDGLAPIFQPKLGGVKFLDTNGDGKIDYNDKKGPKFIKLDKDAELNTVYLASARH